MYIIYFYYDFGSRRLRNPVVTRNVIHLKGFRMKYHGGNN